MAKIEPLRIRKLADRDSGGRREPKLRIPFSAVEIEYDEKGNEVALIVSPADAERILHNPDTPGYQHEAWPLLGILFEDGPPKNTRVSTSYIEQAKREGWVSMTGEKVVHRPGGPPESPWAVTHTFVHASKIIFHTAEGDVSYKVVENPDKWPAEKDGDLGFGGEVKWFYDLERSGS